MHRASAAGSTAVLVGILLGLGMLTKMYAYVLTPILLATVVMVIWLKPEVRRNGRRTAFAAVVAEASGRVFASPCGC